MQQRMHVDLTSNYTHVRLICDMSSVLRACKMLQTTAAEQEDALVPSETMIKLGFRTCFGVSWNDCATYCLVYVSAEVYLRVRVSVFCFVVGCAHLDGSIYAHAHVLASVARSTHVPS